MTLELNGETFLNFCSNDYLGLATHPELTERSVQYTMHYGTGSSSSRLVSGSLQIHHDLEQKIAALYRREAALLFSSGFLANSTLLPALTDRGDLILADKLCHNSLLHGCMLSRAEFRRFRHNDCNHLEELLKKRPADGGTCWVVTESLFSMDGDRAPLDEIIALCGRYGARLYLDDAHAFGLFGEQGLGLGEGRGEVDLLLSTFGKAGGGQGAFAVCSAEMKEYLVNFCAGVIYTTAPAPSVIGAADAALDLVPGMEEERGRVGGLVRYLLERLEELPYPTGPDRTQIIPLLLYDEREALRLAARLYEQKLFVQAIRPPTVQQSRLRITLSALHKREDLDRLLEVLADA